MIVTKGSVADVIAMDGFLDKEHGFNRAGLGRHANSFNPSRLEKELIARAIHKRQQRSWRDFVAVDCAAIPASLIASELFGHQKGTFTGALRRRLGRFELAEEQRIDYGACAIG